MEQMTWRVVRTEETLTGFKVDLARTEWAKEGATEDEVIDAVVGEPGAFWMGPGGASTTLHLERAVADQFKVGQHFVMELREVIDAPAVEFEPA